MMKTSRLYILLSGSAFPVFKIVAQDLIPSIKKQNTTTTHTLHLEILSSFFPAPCTEKITCVYYINDISLSNRLNNLNYVD